MSSHTFQYPQTGSLTDVYLVGSFDNWAGRLPLLAGKSGFELSVPLPPGKVEFKFVTVGPEGEKWVTCQDYDTTEDANGNVNNVLVVDDAAAAAAAAPSVARIPESGGLPVAVSAAPAAETADKSAQAEPAAEPAAAPTPAAADAQDAPSDVKYVKKVHKTVQKSSLKAKLKSLFS